VVNQKKDSPLPPLSEPKSHESLDESFLPEIHADKKSAKGSPEPTVVVLEDGGQNAVLRQFRFPLGNGTILWPGPLENSARPDVFEEEGDELLSGRDEGEEEEEGLEYDEEEEQKFFPDAADLLPSTYKAGGSNEIVDGPLEVLTQSSNDAAAIPQVNAGDTEEEQTRYWVAQVRRLLAFRFRFYSRD
jgi:hypothetical protein